MKSEPFIRSLVVHIAASNVSPFVSVTVANSPSLSLQLSGISYILFRFSHALRWSSNCFFVYQVMSVWNYVRQYTLSSNILSVHCFPFVEFNRSGRITFNHKQYCVPRWSCISFSQLIQTLDRQFHSIVFLFIRVNFIWIRILLRSSVRDDGCPDSIFILFSYCVATIRRQSDNISPLSEPSRRNRIRFRRLLCWLLIWSLIIRVQWTFLHTIMDPNEKEIDNQSSSTDRTISEKMLCFQFNSTFVSKPFHDFVWIDLSSILPYSSEPRVSWFHLMCCCRAVCVIETSIRQ